MANTNFVWTFEFAQRLKNVPRTLVAVASVIRKMMKPFMMPTFQMPRTADPGGTPSVPTATFLRSGGCLNTSCITSKEILTVVIQDRIPKYE